MPRSRPLFITGDTRSHAMLSLLKANGIGRMVVAATIEPYLYEPWAFDNGAYGEWIDGREFDADAYLRRLERAQRIGTPLGFALETHPAS